MKKYTCHECESGFQAETREEILKILYGHYTEVHPDIIPNASDEEKKAWMVQFEKQWAEAPEVA